MTDSILNCVRPRFTSDNIYYNISYIMAQHNEIRLIARHSFANITTEILGTLSNCIYSERERERVEKTDVLTILAQVFFKTV